MTALENLAASIARNKPVILAAMRDNPATLSTIEGWERNIAAASEERRGLVEALSDLLHYSQGPASVAKANAIANARDALAKHKEPTT